MRRLATSVEMPRTAAPPPELFVQVFPTPGAARRADPLPPPLGRGKRHSALGYRGRPRSSPAPIFASWIPGWLHLRWGPSLTWPLAGRRRAWSAETIEARVRALIPRARVYFVVATLEYLARGGRIGRASALLGSLLQIKPILTVRDGLIDQFERQRTQKRALARLRQLVLEQAPRDGNSHLAIMHAAAPEQAQTLASELGNELGIPTDRVPIMHMPPAIVTHAGPGLLGVSFFVAP